MRVLKIRKQTNKHTIAEEVLYTKKKKKKDGECICVKDFVCFNGYNNGFEMKQICK